MIEELLLKITNLKKDLIDIANLKESFTDTEVVKISQELDVVLNQFWNTRKQ
nr:aspartyl-phosphate phosphatase Spo0E family protein [Brevibacillus fluminis]